MPFIDTKLSAKLTKDAEERLRKRFGEAIEILPGKSEEWLMLNFTDGCRMAFRGSAADPVAMIEVNIYGTAAPAALDRLTAQLTKIVNEETGIRPDRIYVKYEECEHWGFAGSNF